MTRGKICPPLRFACQWNAEGRPTGVRCSAVYPDSTQEVGQIRLAVAEEDPSLLYVQWVNVEARRLDEQRCGIGTRLYEHALAEACGRGFRLASDTQRTRFSEGFWKKQVAKGRAECLPQPRKTKRGAEQLDELFVPTGRRWRCRRYALKSCPQKIDLSGAAKRVDWRSESLVRKKR